jgi:hypothetical protein
LEESIVPSKTTTSKKSAAPKQATMDQLVGAMANGREGLRKDIAEGDLSFNEVGGMVGDVLRSNKAWIPAVLSSAEDHWVAGNVLGISTVVSHVRNGYDGAMAAKNTAQWAAKGVGRLLG